MKDSRATLNEWCSGGSLRRVNQLNSTKHFFLCKTSILDEDSRLDRTRAFIGAAFWALGFAASVLALIRVQSRKTGLFSALFDLKRKSTPKGKSYKQRHSSLLLLVPWCWTCWLFVLVYIQALYSREQKKNAFLARTCVHNSSGVSLFCLPSRLNGLQGAFLIRYSRPGCSRTCNMRHRTDHGRTSLDDEAL